MAAHSFQRKLVSFIISLLVFLAVLTLIAVFYANRRSVTTQATNDLRVGSRLFDRLLASRGAQVGQSVRVLSADFAFREAIASSDKQTIESVLKNHGKRIDADIVFLLDLDGTTNAESTRVIGEGVAFPYPDLFRRATEAGQSSGVVLLQDTPVQMILVPVLAPEPVAWVCAAFVLDGALLQDLATVTGLDVSFFDKRRTDNRLLASTLSTKRRQTLMKGLSNLKRSGEEIQSLDLNGDDYLTLTRPVMTGDGERLAVILQKNLEDALRPFRSLQLQLIGFTLLALLISLAGALVIGRSITRPVSALVVSARLIRDGDYTRPVVVDQESELGELAVVFNQMRSGIAEREERITYQATHDALTGLPNRTLFLDRMDQAIAHARRDGHTVGVIMLDLDRFKEINDTLGHLFGDHLLRQVGERLGKLTRETDTVARLGGDEYAMLLTATPVEHLETVARKILSLFDSPHHVDDVAIDVDASLGIASFPADAENSVTLMQRADVAMYEAKRNHTRLAFYESGKDEYTLRRLSLMTELRQAVARDQLELHYQPKIDFATERVVHLEALLRWNHPEYGRIAPDEFIPLAEQSGNIGVLTQWVLRTAIETCGEWRKAGKVLSVAVNLSALDLLDSALPGIVETLLQKYEVPPECLMLEITESGVMKDPNYAMRILQDLKDRGIRLAIDDFGTGYSSLAHLKRMPVDELKIDKGFVMNMHRNSDDAVIVRSTIELGHNMGMRVIAEGVENRESWDILKGFGCDMAQGYFMSPPIPKADLSRWLSESPWGIAPVEQAGVHAVA